MTLVVLTFAHTTCTVNVSGTLNERGCISPFAANDGGFTTQ